jgi:Mrp family chromosome partitioning ATPase
MTALDQAFIKAYVRHGATPAPAPSDSARPIPVAAPAAKTVARPVRKTAGVSSAAASSGLAEGSSTGSLKHPAADSSRRRARGKTRGSAKRAAARQGHAAAADASHASSPKPTVAKPRAATANLRSAPDAVAHLRGASVPALDPPVCPPGPESEPIAPAEDVGAAAEPAVFRPMLEVDRVEWPAVVGRIDSGPDSPLEPLAEALIQGAVRGVKVVAVTACHRGDGCTTVVLASAHRLAGEGLRVAVVDADFDHPRLAKRLGLSPQVGWEDALNGRVPLAEVAIESLDDRLVLLPACEPTANGEQASGEPWDPAALVDMVSQSCDLVLLDLGRFSKRGKSGVALVDGAGRWIDAAVLVQNVRCTSHTELTQAHARLHAGGIAEVFVVENFV